MDRGTFRLGCRYYYRNMEDKSRRDPTEGTGYTREPGIVTSIWFPPNRHEKPVRREEMGYQEHESECTNPIFLFCTSLPDVNLSHLRDNFGQYIVKINDPRRFALDISAHFDGGGQNVLIEGYPVVYNKGQELDRKLADNERLDLSYRQKPFDKYHYDCEFRIAAIRLGNLCKEECEFLGGQFERIESECRFIEVNLGKQLNYAQLYKS